MLKNLKNIIIGIFIGVSISISTIVFAESQQIEVLYDNIKLFVNGTEIVTDEQPFIKNGRTFVPARFVAEPLGAEVIWNESNKSVEINSKIDGLSAKKITFMGISAYSTSDGDILVSAKDAIANKETVLQLMQTFMPSATPTPSPTPIVSTQSLNVGEVNNTNTPVPTTYNGCEAVTYNGEIFILISYSNTVYKYKADYDPNTDSILLMFNNKKLQFKRKDTEYGILYSEKFYIKLSILENFTNS